MSLFFSYSPDSGFCFHATAEEAKDEADACIDYYRDDAAEDSGWPDEAGQVCWGEVKQRAAIVSRKPDESGRFDDIIDYGLVDRNHPSPAAPTP